MHLSSCGLTSVLDELEDDSTSESEEEQEIDTNTEGSNTSDESSTSTNFQKVLSGLAEVKPLKKNNGSQLGYTTKLVSKWYHHECEYNSCPERWAEFDNVDDEGADLVARTKSVPIIHRHHYVNKHWVTRSITVQDSSMKEVLRTALAKYQDLDLDLINWTFEPPFMPLVHRWEEIKAQYIQQQAGPVKNAAAILLAFLAPIVAPSVLSLAQTKQTGKVSFENVWQIFPPSSIVKTKFYGVEAICRVVKYRKRNKDRCNPAGWVIDMEYVDWNGETSGWTTTTLTIWDYEGQKKVTGLPVFPIEFSSEAEAIKKRLTERGRKWASLRGYHFKLVNGTKILLETEEPQQRPLRFKVAGKVCVDAYAYYRSCNIVKPSLRPVAGAAKEEESEEHVDESEALGEDGFESKFAVAQVETRSKAKGPAERVEELSALTDDELLMATPWMKGYDLKSKDFCELNVSELQDMTWNDEAFEKLVLPGGEKELAWTFVENKSQSTSDFDDFVADKGRGLIILMFGPPGVGKTFTAEAVAERSRVPLYSMSAGDLGTKPSEVESALERALELCRMWNAMLLLDEADVFLGERTNESLARNELVSIFLTKLEYYQGILFLTTNRISSIDHAFQSRVDLFLPYHDLTSEARRQVWENFINRAGRDKFELTDSSLDELSQLKLNGREIKNLIKSAQLLSMKNCGKVPVDRLLLLADKRVQALKELDGN
ncbi:ATPase family AAA domain-containing protein [Paramyrothecium foliicola]|nr:ATPase family AAA domain-containing protein [Paramyrothecium foliicola]